MFSDIDNHWARPWILALAQRQLINGYPNGTFRPQATIARAEFAALLQRTFPEVVIKQQTATFRDISRDYWASDAIAWASERAIFSGYPNGTFRPRLAVSRAQSVVVVMAAISGSRGVDATLSIDEAPSGSDKKRSLVQSQDLLSQNFVDAAEIPDYANSAIASALNQNLLENLSNPRRFHPQQALTRGELAALLCRALDIPASDTVASSLSDEQAEAHSLQWFLKQEIGFHQDKLAFLDRGIHSSRYQNGLRKYALRLQQPAGVELSDSQAAPYPLRGEVFFVKEDGLSFLHPDIQSACVCIQTMQEGAIHGRWLGRDALSDRQMWSSTKFIPLLNVAAQTNAIDPYVDISQCKVRSTGSGGRFSGFPFEDLATAIMTYDNRISTSNAIAVMFKRFATPERLEKWTQQLTGNQSLSFQGRYGEVPFIQNPELWSSRRNQSLLKSSGIPHSGQNLMSTYDLTRLITMTGWHWRLDNNQRIPDIQTRSLDCIIRSMAHDTARYVDVALETLGLSQWVHEPVIISKSGFGRSDERNRTELTYCAIAQFSLPRHFSNSQASAQSSIQTSAPDPTAAYQHYSLGFTLIAAQDVGDADEEARYVDALMAASVTELIRRAVRQEL